MIETTDRILDLMFGNTREQQKEILKFWAESVVEECAKEADELEGNTVKIGVLRVKDQIK